MVSVILPTFNERGNILFLIEEAHQKLSPWPHEIIVVDDNSPDGTFEAIQEAHLPYVHPILRRSDPSLAKSIRSGIEAAAGDIVIVMDSDFNHQPQDLPFMVAALNYYDCVIGTRFLYGGSMPDMIRYRLSWLFNIFVRFSIGGSITDNLSGFLAIHKKFLLALPLEEIFYGYGEYYIRLLYHLQQKKLKIVQFPAAYGHRRAGKGNSSFFKIFFQYTRASLRLAAKERRRQFLSLFK